MRADTGPIGGDLSHEFIILADTGESAVLLRQAGIDRHPRRAEHRLRDDLEPDRRRNGRQLYAATDEKHDPAEFEARVPEDRRCDGARHRGRPHLLFRHEIFEADGCRGRRPDGEPVALEMGSYGIGVSRLVGAHHRGEPRRCRHHLAGERRAVQRRADQSARRRREMPRRLRRPLRQAARMPASTCSTTIATNPPGAKFAAMDLIGLPWQFVVGPRGLAERRGRAEEPHRPASAKSIVAPRRRSHLARSPCADARPLADRQWPSVALRAVGRVPLSARAAPGRLHLGHRDLLAARHRARRRDAHHRHVGDERLPRRAARPHPRPQRPSQCLCGAGPADRLRRARDADQKAPRRRLGGADWSRARSWRPPAAQSSGALVRGMQPRGSEEPSADRRTISRPARSTISRMTTSSSATAWRRRSGITAGRHDHADLAAGHGDGVRHGAAHQDLHRRRHLRCRHV